MDSVCMRHIYRSVSVGVHDKQSSLIIGVGIDSFSSPIGAKCSPILRSESTPSQHISCKKTNLYPWAICRCRMEIYGILEWHGVQKIQYRARIRAEWDARKCKTGSRKNPHYREKGLIFCCASTEKLSVGPSASFRIFVRANRKQWETGWNKNLTNERCI